MTSESTVILKEQYSFFPPDIPYFRYSETGLHLSLDVQCLLLIRYEGRQKSGFFMLAKHWQLTPMFAYFQTTMQIKQKMYLSNMCLLDIAY